MKTRSAYENHWWGREFKKRRPEEFDRVVRLLLRSPPEVRIEKGIVDEVVMWCIYFGGYRLDEFKYKQDAENLCAEMGWQVNRWRTK